MEETQANNRAEQLVDNADIPMWQTGLAGSVNNTYTYKNNSLFYGLVPAPYRDYFWRYVRVACDWLDGYVPSLHQGGTSGIISTRIGTKLITGLTKQIVGEKLLFRLSKKDGDKDTLRFVAKWAKDQDIYKAVYAGIGYSLGVGTSLLKANITADQEIWWQAVRMDQCFYLSSFKNEIKDATFLIRGYTDTRKGKNQQFFLVEHRYWKEYKDAEIIEKLDGTFEVGHKKGDRIPMIEYNVHRVTGTTFTNTMPNINNKSSVNWQELPAEIRSAIHQDFNVIKIDEPKSLGLIDLGVVPLLNGVTDLSVPTASNFGESLLVGVQSDMITYEVAASYKIRDMYLGKGTVYIPKSLSMSDNFIPGNIARNGILSGVGEDKYETIKGVPQEEQSIIVNQFDIREEEWQNAMDNALRNMAVKLGMSPKVLASYLSVASATATQIDSEDDMSVAFLFHTRSYYDSPLNKLLETTLNFYGKPNNVNIDFSSPSLINKDRLLDRLIKMLDEGLVTKEEAIRQLYPDDDEEEIQRKIGILGQQTPIIPSQNRITNNYNDLGGNNLNGSTEVKQ